jgi:hypothetical protein
MAQVSTSSLNTKRISEAGARPLNTTARHTTSLDVHWIYWTHGRIVAA